MVKMLDWVWVAQMSYLTDDEIEIIRSWCESIKLFEKLEGIPGGARVALLLHLSDNLQAVEGYEFLTIFWEL